jgi:L-asparagine transporter-like permease
MAVILGLLSFVGIEVVAVTSGELPDPRRTIPAALRTLAIRLFLFYVLALAVVAAIFPWTLTAGAVAVAESPFVKVLALTGIPRAAGVMNFVIISAALSGMNTNVYLCARMLFSLARGGYAPAALGRLSKTGAPVTAVAFSGAVILAAIFLARFTPKAYAYLQGVALFSVITVWVLIFLSHLRFRQVHKAAALPVRMPLFPAMQFAGLFLLGALVVTMGLDPDWRLSWLVGLPWLVLLSAAYFLWRKAAPAATPVAAEGG